jgi:hypothetical protein
MVSLKPDYARFAKVSSTLIDLNQRAVGLPPEYQKLIAENLMLRLFYELEQAFESIALKLITGASYLDGTAAILITPRFKSQGAAKKHILNALSTKKRAAYYLEWTMLSKIERNLSGILNPVDHFMTTRSLHDAIYEDMRSIRNHIAHNSASTRTKFSPLIQRTYATTKGISPAKFLLCQRAVIPGYQGKEMAIIQYIKWSRAFIKTLTKFQN